MVERQASKTEKAARMIWSGFGPPTWSIFRRVLMGLQTHAQSPIDQSLAGIQMSYYYLGSCLVMRHLCCTSGRVKTLGGTGWIDRICRVSWPNWQRVDCEARITWEGAQCRTRNVVDGLGNGNSGLGGWMGELDSWFGGQLAA